MLFIHEVEELTLDKNFELEISLNYFFELSLSLI